MWQPLPTARSSISSRSKRLYKPARVQASLNPADTSRMKVRSLSKLGYIAVFAVITTGCIGTTTPATHVTATSATLNGDGATSELAPR